MGFAMKGSLLLAMALVMSVSLGGVDATYLTYDYYKKSCPKVETIIYQEIAKAYARDNTVAPGILRLIFHDCFVRVRIISHSSSLPVTQQSYWLFIVIHPCLSIRTESYNYT